MGVFHHIRLHNTLIIATSYLKSIVAQPLKALTVILSVCNYPATTTKQQLSNVMSSSKHSTVSFGQKENLPDMFSHCSNGKASFQTDIYETVVNIPCSANLHNDCSYMEWSEYADSYISQKSNVSLMHYPYHIYILPRDICNFGGKAAVPPCYPYCRTWIEGSLVYDVAVYFHELGHNLGLQHSRYQNSEYGDLSDTMGYCCNVRCFNAPHSFQLNWSKPRKTLILKNNIPFSENVELKANEYVLVNTVSNIQSNTFFIQYRKRDSKYNQEIPSPFSNCVSLYQTYPHRVGYTHLKATLCSSSQKWQDNYYGLNLVLISLTKKSAVIKINNL